MPRRADTISLTQLMAWSGGEAVEAAPSTPAPMPVAPTPVTASAPPVPVPAAPMPRPQPVTVPRAVAYSPPTTLGAFEREYPELVVIDGYAPLAVQSLLIARSTRDYGRVDVQDDGTVVLRTAKGTFELGQYQATMNGQPYPFYQHVADALRILQGERLPIGHSMTYSFDRAYRQRASGFLPARAVPTAPPSLH